MCERFFLSNTIEMKARHRLPLIKGGYVDLVSDVILPAPQYQP